MKNTIRYIPEERAKIIELIKKEAIAGSLVPDILKKAKKEGFKTSCGKTMTTKTIHNFLYALKKEGVQLSKKDKPKNNRRAAALARWAKVKTEEEAKGPKVPKSIPVVAEAGGSCKQISPKIGSMTLIEILESIKLDPEVKVKVITALVKGDPIVESKAYSAVFDGIDKLVIQNFFLTGEPSGVAITLSKPEAALVLTHLEALHSFCTEA